ncbi:Exocyst complex component 6B [Blattella germanica]|nr:Exocyst complex component 6B [Blattella germanica]
MKYADMVFVVGNTNGNANAAVDEYRRRYPNRRVPIPRTFRIIYQTLRERGCLPMMFSNQRKCLTEDEVLDILYNDGSGDNLIPELDSNSDSESDNEASSLWSADGRTLLEPATEVSTEVPPLQLPPLDGSTCLAEDVAALWCDSDPLVMAIYDGDEHQKFMERLDARIKNHDKDIERMCNFHYQGFIDSIRELLQVRSQAKKLNSEVVEIDHELQGSAANVLLKGEELVQARKVESNIASAVENLSLCLPVLTTYAKLQRQMKDKSTIQRLTETGTAKNHPRQGRRLYSTDSRTCESSGSMCATKSCKETVSHGSYYPALKTLEQLEHLYLPRVANYRFSHQMKENIPKLRENIKEASMSDLKDFLENIRKFSPKIGEVAMRHTAEQLGSDPGVVGRKKRQAPPPPNPFTGEVDYEQPAESTYDAEEDLSAQDLIDFSPVYRCLHIYTVLGSRETFETYYRKQRKKQARLVLQPPTNMHETIAGYRAYIHGIVGFFVVEDHVLNTGNGLAYCTDATLMLKIKNLIMLFNTTLRRWVQVFREILDEDSFLPIQFSEDLNLSQAEVDDMIRKSTNLLLTRSFSGCLSSLFRKPSLALLQVIQIIIDTGYLEEATVYLEEFVSNITGLREADKKTVFSVLKKSERDKKKLLETVLKQLRQLAMTAQQQ